MTDPLRPRRLRPGDLVRVVAPASPFDRAAFEAGVAVLESWGLRVRARDDLYERRAYLAGSPARRAAELHEAFEDAEAAAVLAVRGGYGVTTALPLLDTARLAAHPKVLVGCSDLTALLGFLVDRAGMAGIHGPMVVGLGRGDDDEGAERLRAILFGEDPGTLRSRLPDAGAWCVSPGTGKGIVVGGSLSLLAATCGTPWQLRTEGRIVLLEDVGERPYSIDRLLVQCAQAGLFEGAAGVVLGDFTGCEEPGGGVTWRDAVDRVFRPLALPVLAGIPFGHGRPNLAMPVGVPAELDAGAGTLRYRRAALA